MKVLVRVEYRGQIWLEVEEHDERTIQEGFPQSRGGLTRRLCGRPYHQRDTRENGRIYDRTV